MGPRSYGGECMKEVWLTVVLAADRWEPSVGPGVGGAAHEGSLQGMMGTKVRLPWPEG